MFTLRHALHGRRKGRIAKTAPQCLAFSLVELLVALSIIAILLSLIIPAVQSARESARKASCSSNVRQCAIALHNFESVHGRYPSSVCGGPGTMCLSPAGQLVDFLGGETQSASIHRVISLPGSLGDFEWDRLPIDAPLILHCPSDGYANGRASSYRFCRGLLPFWPEDPGGSFISFRAIRPADIRDGLSQTAVLSERLIGTDSRADFLRDPLVTPTVEFAEMAADCVSANHNNAQGGTVSITWAPAGSRWLSGNWLHSAYYHFMPPNSAWRDCSGDGSTIGLALMSARSDHPSGVHVGFGDGRSAFASNSIDLSVWRAWATRSGGEANDSTLD